MIAALTAVTLAGLALALVRPPLYQSRAVVQIGWYEKGELIEDPGELLGRLLTTYNVDEDSEKIRPYPRIADVIRDGASVVMIAEGYEPTAVRDHAQAAAEAVVEEHSILHDKLLSEMRLRLDGLNETIAGLELQIQEMGDAIRSANVFRGDPFLASTLLMERAAAQRAVETFLNRAMTIRYDMNVVEFRPTQVRHAAATPEIPRGGISKTMIVIISMVLGFGFALVVLVIRESQRVLSDRLRQTETGTS